jgi:hypothetical protein
MRAAARRDAEEATRPERPASGVVTVIERPGQPAREVRGFEKCWRCGAAPGVACDSAKHDARREYQCGVRGCTSDPTPGHANCDAHAEYPASSVAADLAAWNRHQRGCAACTSAPTAASLCLAGAALWQRARLEVIPVPEARHGRDAGHGEHCPGCNEALSRQLCAALSTSELLRRTAGIVGVPEVAAELRARAAYLETLGDHDHGRVPQ